MRPIRKYSHGIALVTAISAALAVVYDSRDIGQDIGFGPHKLSYWIFSGVTFLLGFGWQLGVHGTIEKYRVARPWLYLGFFAYAGFANLILIAAAPILAFDGPYFRNASISIGIVAATLLIVRPRNTKPTVHDE